MKSESEVKDQLKEVYEHRLNLRISRMTKRGCRNCVYGKESSFDLGEFGTVTKYTCGLGMDFGDNCKFECKFNEDNIEEAMINDISDPSICGAKEPKIAALLWVLHNAKNRIEKEREECGLLNMVRRIGRIF